MSKINVVDEPNISSYEPNISSIEILPNLMALRTSSFEGSLRSPFKPHISNSRKKT